MWSSWGLRLNLRILSETFSICRLAANDTVPYWAIASKWYSITKTNHELSVVCDESVVPPSVQKEDGWKAIEVEGPLDFSLTGVLSSLSNALSNGGISLFSISTYDTDYILVKSDNLTNACTLLADCGCTFRN